MTVDEVLRKMDRDTRDYLRTVIRAYLSTKDSRYLREIRDILGNYGADDEQTVKKLIKKL